MSERAKQAALKAFPPFIDEVGEIVRGGVRYIKKDIYESDRRIFKRGFEQAEEELKLTWQDVQRLIYIANLTLNSLDYEQIEKLGEEGYYTQILKRFLDDKT